MKMNQNINLNILECKCIEENSIEENSIDINLNILECKYRT